MNYDRLRMAIYDKLIPLEKSMLSGGWREDSKERVELDTIYWVLNIIKKLEEKKL